VLPVMAVAVPAYRAVSVNAIMSVDIVSLVVFIFSPSFVDYILL
jgi:hypothetical protein